MNKKTKLGCLIGVITLCFTMPIWVYLWYTILVAVQVDRLTWFLFYAYVPLSFLVNILGEIAKTLGDDK